MRLQTTENRLQKGFTLIEMIISIAIFTIVAVVAVGSLVRIVALNRQAQSVQSSVNNISFALDSMSREIRQGSNIGCKQGYTGEQFTPAAGGPECISMALNNGGGNSGTMVYFQTAKTDSTGCNLYYAYWFMPLNGGYVLEKGQQTSCNQPLQYNGGNGNFFPIIDTSNVVLTGYNLAVFSGSPFKYKWVFIRITGYSGLLAKNPDYFDVQTSLSQRVSD